MSSSQACTGWAQVRYTYGASVEDALEKMQYDLYYVKHMSMRVRPGDCPRDHQDRPAAARRAMRPKVSRMRADITVTTATPADRPDWERFVSSRGDEAGYHAFDWQEVFSRAFGHESVY